MEVKNVKWYTEFMVHPYHSVVCFPDGAITIRHSPIIIRQDDFKRIVEQWCEYMGYELNKKDAPSEEGKK